MSKHVERYVENDYRSRKLTDQCVKRGCSSPPEDDSDLCARHHEADKASKRRYAKRRREEAKAANLCQRCWRVRALPGATYCAGCMIEVGGIQSRHVERNVENNSHAERVAARVKAWVNSPTNAGRARLRGGKRGAPAPDQSLDRKLMDKSIERYREGMAFINSPEGKALPDIDREAARMAALGQLDLALRAGEEILEREAYEKKRARIGARRETEHTRAHEERMRELAKLAKTGR